MAHKRTLTATFFKPTLEDLPTSLVPSFEAIAELDGPTERTVEHRDIPFRIEQLVKGSGRWEGDIVRLRDDLPGKCSLEEDGVSDLGFDDDEYIGDTTAFLYDVSLNVLSLQKNFHGASASAVAHCLRTLANLPFGFYLDQAMQKDAVQRFHAMKQVRTIQLRVAAVSEAAYGEMGLPGAALAELFSESDAPYISLEFRMGNKKGRLSEAAVKFVEGLRTLVGPLNADSNPVKRLRVGGYIDNQTEMIDLLEPWLTELAVFETDERFVPYVRRRDELRKAHGRRRSYLQKYYGQTG